MNKIRRSQDSDLAELAQLCRQTVQVHGSTYYTPEQVKVWADFATDLDHFRRFILSGTTFVCWDETGLLGFSGISQNGHILSAYVRYDRLRQGIGTALLRTVLNYAQTQGIKRVYVEASEFSLKLFEQFGFKVYEIESLERQGVQFQRYLLELCLPEIK